MTPEHIVSQLLESDKPKYPQNLILLKKIILSVYLGRLLINNIPPDNQLSLGKYLFDDERLIFDLNRLSKEKKSSFYKWLLADHEQEKEKLFFGGVCVDEYRGFTAEFSQNWVQKIKNWLKNKYTEHRKINDFALSLHYQMTGIEMCHGQHGILVGFRQYLVPHTGTKYKDPKTLEKGPMGNVKRVLITDQLVEQLQALDINKIHFENICKKPHPQAIEVTNLAERLLEMHEYRNMQKFNSLKPWYVRTWLWIISWFKRKNTPAVVGKQIPLELLAQTERVKIYRRTLPDEILVLEKRPDIQYLVLCGGGAKIFIHVGVWKALCEAEIKPSYFFGSSVGAILALFCYLGYKDNEIAELFKEYKQEHLVCFDIGLSGLSDSKALKTVLDYAIAHKVKQIVEQYHLPFPKGIITFATLQSLRQQCPECGLGKDLTVTGTNKKKRKTKLFSYKYTPEIEVSKAVETSASFPIVFKGTSIDGEEFNDGGVLCNFPTGALPNVRSTLLESEWGNNLEALAVQINNGTERNTIDSMNKVHRENVVLNWFYGLLSGVSDPASGWVRDRKELRRYSSQTVVPEHNNVSSLAFNLSDKEREAMMESGYQATQEYLRVRYSKNNGEPYKNEELMHSTFKSLGDLLSYCAYRGDSYWFDKVSQLITDTKNDSKAPLLGQVHTLKKLYFSSSKQEVAAQPHISHNPSFFGHAPQSVDHQQDTVRYDLLLIIHPLLRKLDARMLIDREDRRHFKNARHSCTLSNVFSCLDEFGQIKGEMHLLLHLTIVLLKAFNDHPYAEVMAALTNLDSILAKHNTTKESTAKQSFYFSKWSLSFDTALRLLKLLTEDNPAAIVNLCTPLKRGNIPLQTIKGEGFYEDTDHWGIQGDRSGTGSRVC